MYVISEREGEIGKQTLGERGWILKPVMEEGSGKQHRPLVETLEPLLLRIRANWKEASPHKAGNTSWSHLNSWWNQCRLLKVVCQKKIQFYLEDYKSSEATIFLKYTVKLTKHDRKKKYDYVAENQGKKKKKRNRVIMGGKNNLSDIQCNSSIWSYQRGTV